MSTTGSDSKQLLISFEKRVLQAAKCDYCVLRTPKVSQFIESLDFDGAVQAAIAEKARMLVAYRQEADRRIRSLYVATPRRYSTTAGADRAREDAYLMEDVGFDSGSLFD